MWSIHHVVGTFTASTAFIFINKINLVKPCALIGSWYFICLFWLQSPMHRTTLSGGPNSSWSYWAYQLHTFEFECIHLNRSFQKTRLIQCRLRRSGEYWQKIPCHWKKIFSSKFDRYYWKKKEKKEEHPLLNRPSFFSGLGKMSEANSDNSS